MDDLAGPVALEPDDTVVRSDLAHLLSLKDGDSFLVADVLGDIAGGVDGFFCDDTRILSRFRMLIGDKTPSHLSHGLTRDNAVFSFHGANLALPPIGGRATPRGVIHVERRRTLDNGHMFERLRLDNFGLDEVMLPIAFEFAADFRDMFEVRGMTRARRGRMHPAENDGRAITLRYTGLDGVDRTSFISFSDPPYRLTDHRAEFMYPLGPESHLELYIEIGMCAGPAPTR